MASILEERLKQFPWRKKALTREYSIPARILEMDSPVVLYPAAGTDATLLEKFSGRNARIIYQDISYGSDVLNLKAPYVPGPGRLAQISNFVCTIEGQGIEVIKGGLEEESLEEKADLVLLKGAFGFLLQNDFAELLLSNCKEGALVIGYRFDLDMLQLLYDGLERESADVLRIPAEYKESDLNYWLTRFPELSFWALKGCFRTFSDGAGSKKKFGEMGKRVLEEELECALQEELDAFFSALPPKLYPRYLRRHLRESGMLP